MRLRTTLLLGLLTGCATTASSRPEASAGGTASAQAPSAAGSKLDFKALSARELAPLSKQQVSAPDGSFTGEVEAAGTPTIQQQEGFVVLSVPLGTRSPLTCFIYSEPLDAGAAVHRLLSKVGQHTDIQLARATDVRLIDDAPAVFAEAQYLVDTPQGKAVGQARLMVHVDDQVPLVCSHDELGYSESFVRITSALAGSLTSPSAGKRKASRYSEFHLVRVEGRPVGFEKRVIRDSAGGAKLTEVETSLLLPRTARELMVQDTVSTELSDKEGRLVARDYARSTNGELDIQMSLELVGGREYHYEGKHSGKDLRGTFTVKKDLSTGPGTARLVREQLLAGKKKELTLRVYDPAANPVAPVDQVLRRESDTGRELKLEMGPLEATLTVDAQGMVEKAEVSFTGNLRMVQERVSVSGSP
ncbi:hypothetical protein [Archangium lipolyticum]|uniref:hypothetical protein n=1 Tax=Archangium lipolyticum TaxID=2970465 RepID=UPI002149C290|nr:hypothetical protein [Archangium lipolyticum]